jgi:hypothetical protein
MLLSEKRELLRQRRTGANPHTNSGYGGRGEQGESVKAPNLVGDLLDLRNVTWRDNSSPFGIPPAGIASEVALTDILDE